MSAEKLDNLQQQVADKFPELKLERCTDTVVLWLEPARLSHLPDVMRRLRDEPALDFKLLVDVTAVHYPDREQPFEMVYHLLSVYRNHRIRVKCPVGEGVLVPSVVGIWSSANWYEREVYEMFGIPFSGHPDLRRLLTEYDFDGYPLRKEFPVEGYTEVRYDAEQGRVVREPVNLSIPNREYYRPAGR
jgi:NADH-quinone oxidoreductase subunit C